jgi:LytS/YehU family sensor histidine kinase
MVNVGISEGLSSYLSWTQAPVRRLFASLALTLLGTFWVWWFIATAWVAPQYGFDGWRTWQGFTFQKFLPTLVLTLLISVFMHGRGFLIEWKEAAAEAERLKKEQIAARYEALKNQVNPHFLFNSLNVLTTLVHKDADLAERFVRQLSLVFRYVLQSREREVAPVAEELEALEAYLFLMKIRFGEGFVSEIVLPDHDFYVAPLSLQMLVENAFKHNEASKNAPLHIRIFESDHYLVVSNNLQKRAHPAESSGIGLENIRSRYQFLSDRPVEVYSDGKVFEVRLPMLGMEGRG